MNTLAKSSFKKLTAGNTGNSKKVTTYASAESSAILAMREAVKYALPRRRSAGSFSRGAPSAGDAARALSAAACRTRSRAASSFIKNTSKNIFSKGRKKSPACDAGRFFGNIARAAARPFRKTFFSCPDYTVGAGISPARERKGSSQTLTAGGESHPAPKNSFSPLL